MRSKGQSLREDAEKIVAAVTHLDDSLAKKQV
jgi:hypothetical protein